MTAFQGQLFFTLPTAIFSSGFLLTTMFVLQDTGTESLAKTQKQFETFFQFESVTIFAEKVGQFRSDCVQLLSHEQQGRENNTIFMTVHFSLIHHEIRRRNGQLTSNPSWRSATSVLAIQRNSSIWFLISIGVLGASI